MKNRTIHLHPTGGLLGSDCIPIHKILNDPNRASFTARLVLYAMIFELTLDDKFVSRSAPPFTSHMNLAESQARGKVGVTLAWRVVCLQRLRNSISLITADSPSIACPHSHRLPCSYIVRPRAGTTRRPFPCRSIELWSTPKRSHKTRYQSRIRSLKTLTRARFYN